VHFLSELWVPILLSTLACHVYAALAWMVLPHHRGDWMRLPAEPELLALLRKNPPKPGQYSFPWHGGGDANRPDFKAAMEMGPLGNMRIGRTAPINMPKMMAQTLFFFLLCSTLTAYVAWHALKLGAPSGDVARIVGAVSVMAYALGAYPESVWFWRPWKVFFLNAIDGCVHAAMTAALFVYFWPQ
jgi:hypothetical protein